LPKNFLKFLIKTVGILRYKSYLVYKMAIEEIVLEAEDRGLRLKLLYQVGELRKLPTKLSLQEVYERAWEELQKQTVD